jgi:hypothetical protein
MKITAKKIKNGRDTGYRIQIQDCGTTMNGWWIVNMHLKPIYLYVI